MDMTPDGRVGGGAAEESRPRGLRRLTRRRVTADIGGALLGIAALKAGQPSTRAWQATPTTGATRRVVDGAGREVEVPANPRRVVALDPGITIVNLVELGVVPVGATTDPTTPEGGFAPVIAEAAARIESVGEIGSASIEKIVSLDPDLIFFATPYQDIPIDRLQAIAPTIAYEFGSNDAAEHLAFVGAMVGREEDARRATEAFAATVAGYRRSLGLEGRRVAASHLLNYESAQTFSVIGPESTFGAILVDVGATLVPVEVAGEPVTEFVFGLSLEASPDVLAEADVIVITRYIGGEELEANFRRIVDSPLWQRVPAIARGDFALLDYQGIWGNWGVRGLELGLADLAAQLANRVGRAPGRLPA